MANEDKDRGYFRTLAAAAPVFALKSIVGDLPKASLEHVVESKALGGRKPLTFYAKQGVKGKGFGRALGGGLGILTAPLFLKGTQLLQSGDAKERRKGYGYVAASTAALAGAKGFFESAMAARLSGANPLTAASKGAFMGTVRSAYKVPVALATAAGIAAGRRGKDDSTGKKYLLPVALGAVAGAVSRVFEEAADLAHHKNTRKVLMSGKGARRLAASGLGGAAGGVLGGLVLAKVVDALAPKKEKKASAAIEKLALLEEAARFLPEALAAGKALGTAGGHALDVVNPVNVGNFALKHGLPGAVPQHFLTSTGMGYKWQNKAVRAIPGGGRVADSLIKTQNNMRSRQFGLGIQEGLMGHSHQGLGASVLSNMGYGVGLTGGLSPESVVPRQMGIDLGRKLRELPEEQRVAYLRKIQTTLLDNPKALVGPGGEVNPLTGHVLGGISMAIGERPFHEKSKLFPTFQKAWINAINKGRGYSEEGLPTQLGKLRAKPGYLAENMGNAATALLATQAGGALPLVGGLMSGHGMFSAVKGAITSSPQFKDWVAKTTHGGYKTGLFPNAKRTRGDRLGNYVLETLVSPATTAAERGLRTVSNAARDRVLYDGGQRAKELSGQLNTRLQQRKHRVYPKEIALPVLGGAGAGLGINYALRNSRGTAGGEQK
jgi:hypothetical protein